MNTWKCKAFVVALLLLMFSAYQAAAQLTANFTANTTHACSPLIVQFTDQSTGNPTSWYWDFGNGNVSTQKDPGAVYLDTGYSTVTLIISDGVNSDTLVMPNYIEVYANPTAKFKTLNVSGCAPYKVCFADSSVPGSGAITSWYWDFGDGHSDSTENSCNSYSTAGNYSVSLFVQDTNGCSDEALVPNLVNIVTPPIAGFTSNVNSSCTPPLTVKFEDTSKSSVPLSYSWNFGDGTTSNLTNPSHNYSALGEYNVSLVVVNNLGCSDTVSKTDFVAVEQLVAKFSAPTSGCIGSPVPFIDSSTSHPTVWRWDFGDGDTSTVQYPTHAYTAAGTYTIRFYAANTTCGDSIVDSNYITIAPSPTASFTCNDSGGCTLPFVVQFTDQSQNAISWQWNFGDTTTSTDTNPEHTYNTPGDYTVQLTVVSSNGCANTLTKNDYIDVVEPQVKFTADTIKGCIPLTVTFTDSSTSYEPIVYWNWDFGDGTTSNMQNPTHTYTSDGIYTVTLSIINSAGCTDTLVDTGYIMAGTKPTVNFTANPLSTCMYTPVSFYNQSDSTNEWYWNFGDGSTSLSESPSHEYSDTGTFTITLIAMNNGCADTVIKPDYVHIAPPHAAFLPVLNCINPFSVQFEDQSLAPNEWYWSFGDGDTSTAQNPQHTYAARGTYTVTLTVTDSVSGCFDIYAKPIIISDPVAGFYAPDTNGCRPFTATFIDSSVDAVAYLWKTDNLSSAAGDPSFLYSQPGIFSVTEIITDVNGCKDSVTRTNYITVKGPTAAFSGNPQNGCAPLSVNFTDTSSDFLGTITSWLWQFGDGDTSHVQNPTHIYTGTATYNVTLTVTDSNGCSNTLTKSSYIKPTFPKPSFTAPTLACTGMKVNFTSTSVAQSATYTWYFGDGDSAVSQNASHQYANQGVYTITLKVVDINGCDSTLVMPNYLTVANPVARFSADTMFSSCPPLIVNFRDTSFGNPVSWKWNFGDGGTSAVQNPSHVYRSPGSYPVSLVITNALGCTDSIDKPGFIIVGGPSGSFNFAPKDICEGGSVIYTATTTNTSKITWDFGDGTVEVGVDSMSHIYDSSGVYHPVLILEDSTGCVYPIAATDSVVAGYLHPVIAPSTRYLCKHGNITFTDSGSSSTPITNWLWNFGDSSTSALKDPVHYYAQPGVYTVTLKVTNSTCIDSVVDSALIVVDSGPQTSFVYNATPSCTPFTAYFTNTTISPTPIDSVFWTFGDGTTDTTNDPSHFYGDAGTYTITLLVTSVTGCSNTATRSLVVHTLPVALAGSDTAICYSYSTTLHGAGGVIYLWSPGASLNDSTTANPVASPTVTTTYNLLVTDSFGCRSNDTVKIWVNPLPVSSSIPDTVICAGNYVQMWANGGDAYQWEPYTTLNCSNCNDPLALPVTTTSYVVKVVDSFGCYVYDTTLITVNPMPGGVTAHNVSMCQYDTAQLVSTGGTSFTWTPAYNISCDTCASITAYPDTTTTYSLDISNQYNCGFTDYVTVTVNPLPELIVKAPLTICQGTAANFDAYGATNYIWVPATGLSCANCASPVAIPAVNTTYHIEGISDSGCKSYDSLSVMVVPVPQIQTIGNTALCLGDSITMTSTVSDSSSFNWSPALGLNDSALLSPVASPGSTTQYVLSAINQYGCTASDSVLITSVSKVKAVAGIDTTICFGNAVQLYGQVVQQGYTGSATYWANAEGIEDTFSLSPMVKPLATQTYDFIATSGSCIPDTEKVTVTVKPLPTVTIAPVEKVVNGTIVKLESTASSDVVAYSWTPSDSLSCANCADPEYFATGASQTFTLTVTSEDGCQAVDSVTVFDIGHCGSDVFVPNLFTPNGDEQNDVLYVRGVGLNGLKVFRVFDRWGNQIFETTNINDGWDGTVKGVKAEQGVYIYYVEVICTNGQVFPIKGNVTLIR